MSTPSKVKELVDLWYHEAGRYNGLPLDDRTALEILLEERPQLTVPRERYVYRPGLSEVPEASAVNIRNRSFTIAAEVEIADANAGGVRLRPRLALRRPRPLSQERDAEVRQQLLRHHRADRGGVRTGADGQG